MTMPPGNTTESPLPLASFQELVTQHHHRLASLEADLKDQARSGAMPARAFAARVKRLAAVHKDLEALRRICLAEAPAQLAAADVGLPLLGECTPAELAVCGAFLAEKAADFARLCADTGRVHGWLAAAVAGRTGPFAMMLRLSGLRRTIQRLETRQRALAALDSALTAHIEAVPAAAHPAKGGGRGALEGLMALFSQLDATIARVASLKATVKSEEARVRAMQAWLAREDALTLGSGPPMGQPSPLGITRAAAAAGAATLRSPPRRRRLLAQFWDEVTLRGMGAPAHKLALGGAAAELVRHLAARTSTTREAGK